MQVVQANITTLAVDAVVNAANTSLLGGGGVDGAIHRAAGPRLLEACRNIRARQGGCDPGKAVMTPGYLLSKYVIHTVGPVWQDGKHHEDSILASCYWESLQLALDEGCHSIAFPAISTGIYKFPPERAARIAVEQCRLWIDTHPQPETIILVAFDTASRLRLEQALLEH